MHNNFVRKTRVLFLKTLNILLIAPQLFLWLPLRGLAAPCPGPYVWTVYSPSEELRNGSGLLPGRMGDYAASPVSVAVCRREVMSYVVWLPASHPPPPPHGTCTVTEEAMRGGGGAGAVKGAAKSGCVQVDL